MKAVTRCGAVLFAAVSLAAGHFEQSVAAASASRWSAAIYALLTGAAYIARDPLRATLKRLPWLRWDRFSRGAPSAVRGAGPTELCIYRSACA